jgi:hypothetical protein
MGVSPAIAVPETQSSTDFVDYQFETPVASLPIEESDIPQTGSVREQASGGSYLSFFLITAGLGVYFIAIAAFASFPGVAIGVFVMVLGAIIYTCRGLGGPAHEYQTALSDPSHSVDTATITPSAFGDVEADEFALPEAVEKTAVNTEQIPAAV